MTDTSRDYRFDNLKGLLIFLVILGHALPMFQSDSMKISRCITCVIFSFHMPAFVFISGYFSKNVRFSEHDAYKAVKSLLIPFVIANSLMWLLTSRSLSTLFDPRRTLWYLLSLFFWKLFITPVSKIRFSVVISFIIAILVGFSPADRQFSLSRTITFFPFFLLGYKTAPSAIDRIRRIPKVIPMLILLASFSVVIMMQLHDMPMLNAFQLADPYSSVKEISRLQSLSLRVFTLAVGCISTACLLILAPNRQSIFTRLGKNTITVYLAHYPFLMAVRRIIAIVFPALVSNEALVIVFSFAVSILCCCIFANRWIVSLYYKVMNWVSEIVLVQTKQKPDLSD